MIYKSYLQYTISKFVKEPQESEKRRTASSYDVYDVINQLVKGDELENSN